MKVEEIASSTKFIPSFGGGEKYDGGGAFCLFVDFNLTVCCVVFFLGAKIIGSSSMCPLFSDTVQNTG